MVQCVLGMKATANEWAGDNDAEHREDGHESVCLRNRNKHQIAAVTSFLEAGIGVESATYTAELLIEVEKVG